MKNINMWNKKDLLSLPSDLSFPTHQPYNWFLSIALYETIFEGKGPIYRFSRRGSVKNIKQFQKEILELSNTKLAVVETKQFAAIGEEVAIVFSLGRNNTHTVDICGTNKELIDKLREFTKSKIVKKQQDSVYIITSTPSGLTLSPLGSVAKPLERSNYSDEVLHNFDYVVRELKSAEPKGRLAIFNGPPGCQPGGSKVLMFDGSWKNIEDVKEGDFVKSPQYDGSVIDVKVLETLKYENRDIYKVQTNGRNKVSYLASHNHIIPIIELKTSSRKLGKRIKYSKITEMNIDSYNLKSNAWKSKARIFTAPAYDLPRQEFLIHPYIMGCVLGDGSVSSSRANASFTYHKDNLALVEEIRKLGAELSEESIDERRTSTRSRRFLGETNKKLKKILEMRKGEDKKIPNEYMRSSLQQRLDLLAGLVDTDGTFEEFSSKSKCLAEQFKELIFSVGGYATCKKRITKCKEKEFESYRVYYSLGEYQIPVRLEYKKQRKRNMKWKSHRNKNFSVSYVGKDTVYGFSLSGQSQWYVTDNFMVTHNTGKTYAVRGLVNEVSEYMCVMLPAKFVSELDSPNLVPMLLEHRFYEEENKPMIMILEDADSCLAQRSADNMSAISSLLNYTDGIFGTAIDLRIVATTNAEYYDMEPALMRPGRLIKQVTFGMLPTERANEAFQRLTNKTDAPFNAPATLAEVYATAEGAEIEKKKEKKVGF